MKPNPLIGTRVEFLSDVPPAVRGDRGTVFSVKTLHNGVEVVVVESHGKFLATYASEIRLLPDQSATTRLSSRAQDAAKQNPADKGKGGSDSD